MLFTDFTELLTMNICSSTAQLLDILYSTPFKKLLSAAHLLLRGHQSGWICIFNKFDFIKPLKYYFQ